MPILLAVASYVLGGIPSGYLIAKYSRGIDIREHGSGNPGAANVYRVVGQWAGSLTLALDSAKGFFPVFVSRHLYPGEFRLHILCGSLAVLGHIWTIFLKFQGGKGVATSAGLFAALLPIPTLLAMAAFLAGTGLSGHISTGSICAATLLPTAAWMLREPKPLAIMATLVCLLILIKHTSNIKRILTRRELSLKPPSSS